MKDAFETNRGGNQNEVHKALKEWKASEDLADRIKTNAKQYEKYDSEGKQESDNSTKAQYVGFGPATANIFRGRVRLKPEIL